ncbi:MAG: chitobiase/beta-hexosaminidase C-terminal domain-containing protein [Armatimonadota bacterium]
MFRLLKLGLVCVLLFAVAVTPSLAYQAYLYVSVAGSPNVNRYIFDSTSPLTAINAPSAGQTGAVFATSPSLVNVHGIAIDETGGYLYASGFASNNVGRFDLATGAFVDILISSELSKPEKMIIGPDGNLYIANCTATGTISRFTKDGTPLPAPGKTGALFAEITQVMYPSGITFGPDGKLYVANQDDNNCIYRYDGTTGEFDPCVGGFFANSNKIWITNDVSFGSDGNLYVASIASPGWGPTTGRVVCFDGATGALKSVFADRKGSLGLAWGPNGNLFVTGFWDGDRAIKQYDGTTGAFVSDFVPDPGSGTGLMPCYMAFSFVPTVAPPVFTPDGGYHAVPLSVTITCATSGANIYYTTDGSAPTTSSFLYTGTPIAVNVDTTLMARAFKAGMAESVVKSSDYVFTTSFNRPETIPYANSIISIDGNLTEWADAEWAPLDQNFDGDPADIAEAYYAAKWGDNGNRIYVAVKVRDTAHSFTDTYLNYDARDAIEMYIHTTGDTSINYYPAQADAQHYTIGFKTDGASLWEQIGYIPTDPHEQAIPAHAGFQAAGTVAGQWLNYEAAITPFHYFSLSGVGIVPSTLVSGQIIGFDVCAVGHNGAYTGMKAENLLGGKSSDWTSIGRHLLVNTSNIADTKKSVDGTGVVVSGIISAAFDGFFYVESVDRSHGIRVNKASHGLVPGQVVTVNGILDTLDSSERFIEAIGVSTAGFDEVTPLGLTNKALGGGVLGTLPNGQAGVEGGSGLNNIGLLVKTTGRVTTSGTDWFKIDDGSGVSVKILGTKPTGTPYVTVTGIVSCENQENAIERVIIATNIQVVAP